MDYKHILQFLMDIFKMQVIWHFLGNISTQIIEIKWMIGIFSSKETFWVEINPILRVMNSNFAQWRYSNQWSNREVLLLLVENYNQYPALDSWNIDSWGNFWRLLREQLSWNINSKQRFYQSFRNSFWPLPN